MPDVERSARTVEEALEAALAALGATEQQVDVEVVQEPKGGLFGRGQNAVVRVRLRSEAGVPTEEELDEQAEIAADFLEELLERMGIAGTVEPNFEDGSMYVDVLGEEPDDDDMALLIGRHGQTLEGLQEITRAVVSRKTGERCRVMVDIEDYRKRQRDRLIARARDAAKQVLRTGKSREMEAMNAYDRKIIHGVVSSMGGLKSASTGEEPDRRVVIQKA